MFYIHILERFLDLDLAVVNGQMSETQMSVYHEAQARIDKKVIFSKGKFEMNLRSGSEVGISDRLFDHFKTCMDAQNRNLAEAQSDGLIPVEVSPNVVRFIDLVRNDKRRGCGNSGRGNDERGFFLERL